MKTVMKLLFTKKVGYKTECRKKKVVQSCKIFGIHLVQDAYIISEFSRNSLAFRAPGQQHVEKPLEIIYALKKKKNSLEMGPGSNDLPTKSSCPIALCMTILSQHRGWETDIPTPYSLTRNVGTSYIPLMQDGRPFPSQAVCLCGRGSGCPDWQKSCRLLVTYPGEAET